MLRTILNKSWRQHPTKHRLYSHLPPITKTIQVRRTRHAGHCWRSRDELISDVLLWTPTYGRTRVGRPARTYIPQLCEDTVCSPEDLPEAMNDREKWREGVKDFRASGTTRWWFLPSTYNKFHIQSVLSAIRRELKTGKVVITNLFRRRILCNSTFAVLLVGWLVGWLVEFLWHINLCRLFNAKSIFIYFSQNSSVYITTQFSVSTVLL